MSDKLSLIGFFNNKEYSRIEIPKIQRDYAQGRENESEVADRFLNKIFECFKENKDLELDFIYGSVNENTVYLLDGQQRVTTLFLLHWYIALREDIFNEEIKECLKKFTYSTRVSSREFCQNIINNIEDIKDEIAENDKKENDEKKKLSDIIKDFYWFTNENDPTIKAMLNMIDKIDEKYNEITKDNNSIKLFDNLEKIQFYFLPLEDFKLTDEIYLKMNARGKPLTSFENFKADLTGYILKINGNEINISQQQLSDLDNKYTNFFWELYKKDKKYDNLYIKFFYRITLIYFIINYEESNEKLTDNEYYKYLKNGSFEELNEKNKYSSFNAFKKTYDENKNIIEIIFKVLDLLENEYNKNILNTIKPIWDQNDYDILSKIKYEYKDIIIFSALIFYIEKNDYYKKSFKQWMRIVWNITENSNINEHSSISLIKLFNKLSEHSSNIYNFLANEKNIIDTNISKEAVQYERRKCKFLKRRCKLIIKDKNWEKFFIKAEKYKFFKGYINFLIDDNMDMYKFKNRVKLFCSMFNDDGKYTFDEEHLFLRALISNITDINDFRNKKVRISDNLKNLINILKDKCYDNDTHDYIKKLLDSKNKYKLKKKLENEVSKDSKINLDIFSPVLKERIKLAHKALKDSVLQNWIYAVNENNKHKNTTMIVDWRDHCLYLLFPRLERVLIGSYRNQLISDLKGMITNYDNIKNINNAYYTGSDIEIKIKNENEEYILNFDRSNKLTIKKDNEDLLDEKYRNLNDYTFDKYKEIIKTEFFDKYKIKVNL